MSAWQGRTGVSEYEGIVSPAYFVLSIRKLERRVFHGYLARDAYVPIFAGIDGVRIGQWDLVGATDASR